MGARVIVSTRDNHEPLVPPESTRIPQLRNPLRFRKALSRAQADHRHELPVEIPEPIWPKLLYSPQRSRGIDQEHLDIDALTSRRERCQVARAARQHVHRPVVVPAPKMVKRDANLQDALIEAAYLALLSPPQQLQCLVLLEVLAAVELGDPLPQKRRWRFVALTHGTRPRQRASECRRRTLSTCRKV